ncbi:MAG: hypothetical protein HQ463_06430 [Bacteroidetes bacterium]|nr:hypothetical protein [Bacteroidota bacterium]
MCLKNGLEPWEVICSNKYWYHEKTSIRWQNKTYKTNTTYKINQVIGDKYLPETKIFLENATQSSNSSTTSFYGEVTLRFKTIY